MRSPKENAAVKIQSYKHNGRLHREWATNFILKATNTYVIGANDKVKVTEDDGRFWITREPAILYFHAEYWFNVIGMIREDGVHYYCNISSPYLYDGEAIKYIDYDLDVRVFPNMTYVLLDEDEYEQHKNEMNYPPNLDLILTTQLEYLLRWIHERKGPFSPEFIDHWYEQYLLYH